MKSLTIGITVVAILAVVLIGSYFVFSNSSAPTNISNNPPPTDPNVKTFQISADNFKFVMNGVDNPEIRVKQGDKVRIELTNTNGFHDWKLDEFNAATKRLNTGQSDVIEFVADKNGTFEYYCSVGEHRAMGMKGTFIVE
jgi:plastocyanin